MVAPIAPIVPPVVAEVARPGAAPQTGTGFPAMLEGYVSQVQKSQDAAQASVNSFLSGGSEEVHSVALATQRAELEFEMFLQVRNKVVSAYQEIMKMQI